MSQKQDGVCVSQAEAKFENLKNEFTQSTSELTTDAGSGQETCKSVTTSSDVEKGSIATTSEEQPFDLEATLRGYQLSDRDAGVKPKRLAVLWEGLTVKGIGGLKVPIQTITDTFLGFFNVWGHLQSWLNLGPSPPQIDLLHDFNGIAKPGEMILVLGRPGSGCSTFLKMVANQRAAFTGFDGSVQYGPFSSQEFEKQFRGEAVYNAEEDDHHATLTVEQTLGFAIDLKTPAKRPSGIGRRQFKQRVIDLLLTMFNIEHTRHTVVGDASVRGISGGERKRVSIAEMMITSATVLSWDNTTRGLDAATALDLAKSLRIMTNVYQTTTFASLYQASDSIYEQFDKVLVIDRGKQVYFGPTKKARAYFESLGFKPKPRASTPDFLTGCTDPRERELDKTYAGPMSSYDPEDLRKAWQLSSDCGNLQKEMEQHKIALAATALNEQRAEFTSAQQNLKGRHSSNSSVYTSAFYTQVLALTRRQYLIKWQDKFTLLTGWATSVLVAVVLGTVWLDLPQTSAGAFTRGGLLFISLLFNAFQAFGEVASSIFGRNIIERHKAYTFYRPSALWLAQVIVDLTFAASQILIFSIMVYFMCGLVRDIGAFFIFYLAMLCGYMAMSLFFRTVGCLCPDFDYALKFLTFLTTIFILTAGYMIQWSREQVWLRWLFYVNGLGLSFSVLMMNEFQRINMTCTAESTVPSGSEYTNLTHQVCTLPGSTAGSDKVSGQAYITDAFSYHPGDLWRHMGIVIGLILGFIAFNLLFGETISFGSGGMSIACYQNENAERKRLNAALQDRKLAEQNAKYRESSISINKQSNSVLTWEDLSYDVPVSHEKAKTRRLLHNIYGYVRPGQLVALMGASGAGKTTLLDVLAKRKSVGIVSGKMLIDGCAPGIEYQRRTGYSEQFDVHEMTSTVREALRFSADLRQPAETPQSEKYAYVEEVISLLEMEDVADAMIGMGDFGLSVEQRKRLTIGVELASKPELLLFLDEPTTGLDSQSAHTIVSFLRRLAAAGQAIICTIHQPNAVVFENFDRLILLEKGGRTVYFGDIGHNVETLLDYFRTNGADCPIGANPAEWMLDAIGAGRNTQQGDRLWSDVWLASPEFARVKEEIAEIQQAQHIDADRPYAEREYAASIRKQIRIVNWRTQLSYWRSPNYGFTRWFNHVIPALLTGLVYLQLDDSVTSLQYRIFVVFQATVLPGFILGQVQFKYDFARMTFYRESAAKMYSQIPFALGLVLAEIPYTIVSVVCFFLLIYFIPGLQSAPDRAGYQFFTFLTIDLFSVTLGQLLAALTPSSQISMLLNPVLIIVFSLLCGVTVPAPQIPGFWRDWLYQLNPFTRLIQGMATTELHDLPVVCQPDEFKSFPAPGNLTCGEYMHDFFSDGGAGYLLDNMTSACKYCAYKVGDQFYESIGLSFETRWRDLGVLIAFCGANLLLLALACRYLNFNKR